MTEYLDSSKPFPYCPGCGHSHVLRGLDEALQKLVVPHGRLVIVTDIGCVGLADSLFPAVHTVHTLHGRSVAIAAGLALGLHAAGAPPLKTVVLIGDGGAGLGLLHLVHASQINVDVTVLINNNLIYGMTGGQHSVLTPPGMKTTTTPDGCQVPPLDIGAVLQGARAGFFARATANDKGLTSVVTEAIEHPGFACVEVFALCPTFATRRGGITGKGLRELPDRLGLEMGIQRRETQGQTGPGRPVESVEETWRSGGVEPRPEWSSLDRTARVLLAGRAGERVQSAALLAASAACAAGLQATVRADNPVTQGSGFSLAELTVAPEPIAHTALVNPDLVLVTASEGHAQLKGRGLYASPGSAGHIVIDAELEAPAGTEAESSALRSRFGPKQAALGALMEQIGRKGWWQRSAWDAAIERLPDKQRDDARATLAKVDG